LPLRATAPPPSEISISISSSASQHPQQNCTNKSVFKTPAVSNNINYVQNEPLDSSILEDQQIPQQQQIGSMIQNYSKLNIGMKDDSDGVEEVSETLIFCNGLNERVYFF
jgi:hypothetical protein